MKINWRKWLGFGGWKLGLGLMLLSAGTGCYVDGGGVDVGVAGPPVVVGGFWDGWGHHDVRGWSHRGAVSRGGGHHR